MSEVIAVKKQPDYIGKTFVITKKKKRKNCTKIIKTENITTGTELKFVKTRYDIVQYFEFLIPLQYEKLYIVGTDCDGNVTLCKCFSNTTDEDEATFCPQEIFRDAVRSDSVNIYMIHNHPSGDTTPSDIDENAARHIALGCKLLGMLLVDSIIIGSQGPHSMLEDNSFRTYSENKYKEYIFGE